MAKQFAAQKPDSEDDDDDAQMASNKKDVEESDDDSSDGDGKGKLGDKLFESDDEGLEESKKAAELNAMDPELVRKIIESDSPELMGLL